MRSKWLLFAIGWIIVLAGSLLAYFTQTTGGVRIQDIRFTGSNGVAMSALLYVPPGATNKTPAPGVLAVHGYINSRETQSGFAIEFARRGYVVLAIDQTGHGYSAAPAFANGFGGPDGLSYLRGLDFVDPATSASKATAWAAGRPGGGRRLPRRLQGDGAGRLEHRQPLRRRKARRPIRATSRWSTASTTSSRP